jgi:hypothetical protein
MSGFLNAQIAQEDAEDARRYEVVQARTERDLTMLRVAVLESLLKQYANKIVELEMRIAMFEAQHGGNING